MTITPHLERLIWEGKAAPRTWATGGSGSARIIVPKNRFIVITGITWFPFTDERNIQDPDTYVISKQFSMLHLLNLYSSKVQYLLNFRENFTAFQPQISVAAPNPYITNNPGSPIYKPCYYLFDENVRINVLRNDNSPPGWSNTDFSAMPDTSDELNINTGVQNASGGVVIPVMRTFTLGAAPNAYVQPAADQVPTAPVGAADVVYQYHQIRNAAMGLNNPNAFSVVETNGMNFPLINFDYVEVFYPFPNEMIK